MKLWTALNLLLWLTVLVFFLFTEGLEQERNILLAMSGASTAAFFLVKIINTSSVRKKEA